ncbi:hypothetical protein SUGI_1170670 [Cryptomeria japonica]|uniref:uncharacterized protein LOC131068289 n=1 Tax=Cryptomeria japonica TaxID=3369 RepID=UPI002414C18D|nr:uncharacterized protein LOC131068289 [Cryptomeria japonica]GLJ54507.1 hypothetical protein SUGI_1170670 [Cryptomeria japonica]
MDRGKGEEGSENYVEGGYHPVNRGDLLNEERYVVQSKLGWGGFSTVWLAWDTQLNKYVALKISRSKDYFRETALREIETLKVISEADPDDKECVVKLLDYFMHSGPNGNHVCLVLELLGDNLRTLLKHYSGKGIPLNKVKEICFHILRGLDFLHGKLSIVHTDLKPENILLLSTIDPKKDPKKLGVPLIPSSNKGKSIIATSSSSGSNICKKGNQQIRSNQKGKLVAQDCGTAANEEEEKLGVEAQTRTWGNEKILSGAWEGNLAQRIRELNINSLSEKQNSMSSLDLKCKIGDMGNARWLPIDKMGPIQTHRYKCPETLLGSSFSTPADIWSVGCIAFELATGDFLFSHRAKNNQEKLVNHLGLMIELLGVMPWGVATGGKVSRDLFDNKGNVKGYRKCGRKLIDLLRDKFGYAKKNADDFRDFLVPLLHFVPEKRPTAMQALLHPWLGGGPRLLQPSSSAAQTQQNAEVIPEEKTAV